MDNLKKVSEDKLKEMFSYIDNVNIENLKTDGMTIRIGNQIVKLTATKIENISIEDEIREEFRIKLSEKLNEIKVKLNDKIIELVDFTNRIKEEADRKEREIEERLRTSCMMPDINIRHAKQGLSCVKGERKDEIIWLVQGIYWPKTVGDGTNWKKIEPAYAKKMISSIIFMIVTEGKKVKGVSTRKPVGLDYFEHYHQSKPDCWGKWSPKRDFKGPDDIIKIAKEAEAVLENINPRSLADRSPLALPRFATLERHLLNKPTEKPEVTILNQEDIRSGIRPNTTGTNDNLWSI
jgi:hypothetical protein